MSDTSAKYARALLGVLHAMLFNSEAVPSRVRCLSPSPLTFPQLLSAILSPLALRARAPGEEPLRLSASPSLTSLAAMRSRTVSELSLSPTPELFRDRNDSLTSETDTMPESFDGTAATAGSRYILIGFQQSRVELVSSVFSKFVLSFCKGVRGVLSVLRTHAWLAWYNAAGPYFTRFRG